jgi:hypothetical protein
MTAKLREYVPEDAVIVSKKAIEQGLADYGIDLAEAASRAGTAWTIESDGKPIACAGIVMWWKGVGEAWMIASPEAVKHKISFIKALKAGLEIIIKTYEMHRVESKVRVGFESAIRINEILGFKQDAVLKKFTPDGQDVILFSIVR